METVVQNSTSTFSSQHLYLVAFLVCAGHGITDLVRNGRRYHLNLHKPPNFSPTLQASCRER